MMRKWAGIACIAALIGTTTGMAATPFVAAVKENGHWGAINGTNKKIVPIAYDKIGISLATGKHKDDPVVAKDIQQNRDLDLIEVQANDRRGFYDRNGKVIVPVSYEQRSAWTDRMVMVRAQNKYGYYDIDGKAVASPQYDAAAVFCDGYAGVGLAGRYGFIDLTGKAVIPFIYDAVGPFREGLAAVRKDGKWGVIDTAGHSILPCRYDDMQYEYDNGFIGIKQNGLWGFADAHGNIAIAPQFKRIVSGFQEHRAAVETNDGYEFIDEAGHAVSPSLRDVYTPFNEGLAAVKEKDGTKGYMDTQGRFVFKADYTSLGNFQNGLAEYTQRKLTPTIGGGIAISIGGGNDHTGSPVYMPSLDRDLGVAIGADAYPYEDWTPYGQHVGQGIMLDAAVHNDKKRGYIDRTGKVVVSSQLEYVYPMTENGTFVADHGCWGYVRRDGTYLVPAVYKDLESNDHVGLFLARNKESKWGALSLKDGTVVVPFTYDALKASGDILTYKENGRYGILKGNGTAISDARYDEVGEAADGLIPVREKDRWYYIDMTGSNRISLPAGTKGGSFANGYAPIKSNGKWGVIDTNGTITTQPVYDSMTIL